MLRNSNEKYINTFFRLKNMEVMKWCLNTYKETKDKEFYEWAKVFGNWSEFYKKQLEELK